MIKLIEYFLRDASPLSIRDFIHTYSFYGTSKQFLEAIKRAYLDYRDERIVNILTEWITSEDRIPKKVLLDAMKWGEKNISNTEKLNLVKLGFIRGMYTKKSVDAVPLRSCNLLELIDMPSPTVAQALTCYEFGMFKNVQRKEFARTKRPSITKMIDHFNKLSLHVATVILSEERHKQTKIVEKWIAIAEECEQLGNLNTVMTIIAGLSNVSIQRLRYIWAELSERSLKKYEELELLMSTVKNYSNYRQFLKTRKGPILPYVGIYLRDFFFVNEGMKPYLDDGHINPEYCDLIGNTLKEIHTFQHNEYKLSSNPDIEAFLNKLPFIDDETLYRLSIQCRPQSADSSASSSSSFDSVI